MESRVPYYYLTASLPSLALEDPMPFTVEEFRDQCASLLSENDLPELDYVLAGSCEAGQSVFCRAVSGVETQLRNALVRVRAGQRRIEGKSYLHEHRGFSVTTEEAVTDACTKNNPLERERDLDRYRWIVAADLAREDIFGLPAVLAFGVHLKLMERWSGMSDESGQNRLKELIDDLTVNEALQRAVKA